MKTSVAKAVWQGNLAKGTGMIRLNTTGYETPYNAASRFENGKETNPEEFIAAAHAACFSMALANELSKKGFIPDDVTTEGHVSMDRDEKGPFISRILLSTSVKAEGLDERTFQEIAEGAKKNCPVSKALSAVKIELKATLLQTVKNPA